MGLYRPLIVVIVAALALAWLVFLVRQSPAGLTLSFPSDVSDIRRIVETLRGANINYVLLLFSSAYLFKQTFAIPGSALLNLLAGAIFGLPVGLIVCSALTGLGASCCSLLARFCGGRELALKYFPHRLRAFREQLDRNRPRLPYFLLFLRLFPASPNWAINVLCGVLEVPLLPFFFTAVLGLMPYNYICVQTGVLLSKVQSVGDIMSWGTALQLSAVAFVALIPGLLHRTNEA